MGSVVWILCAVIIKSQLVVSTPFPTYQVQLSQDDVSGKDEDYDADYVNDNPVIEVDDTGTPVCPPLVKPLMPEFCRAKTCRHDSDCGVSSSADAPELVCCYNGCVRTCQIRVSPPHFFDWPHDTPSSSKELPNRLWNGHQLESEAEVELEGPDIVVTLPGGCHLTQPKFDRFKLFQEDPNTRRCYCESGGVYCQLQVDWTTNSTVTVPLD